MSYENAAGLGDYFEKRVRRIYPAYFTVVLLCSLLGVLITSYSWVDYLSSADLYRYLAANLVFLNFIHPDLPGGLQRQSNQCSEWCFVDIEN